ncbi:MAG: hypothetical protein QXP84_07455 [Candidatus Korarchaeum sp.]
MERVPHILSALDEEERKLNELIVRAATLEGFQLEAPGKIPDELIPSVVVYLKRISVLRISIDRLVKTNRALISSCREAILSGFHWRINPMTLSYIRDTNVQLEAAIRYLEETNEKLRELVDRVYEYKVKLSFNQAFGGERR